MQVTFEFDLNLYRIDRAIYSILDWISDIGGLKDGIILIIKALIPIMNFKTFEHFLIEHLFVKRDLEPCQENSDTKTDSGKLVPLKQNKTRFFR